MTCVYHTAKEWAFLPLFSRVITRDLTNYLIWKAHVVLIRLRLWMKYRKLSTSTCSLCFLYFYPQHLNLWHLPPLISNSKNRKVWENGRRKPPTRGSRPVLRRGPHLPKGVAQPTHLPNNWTQPCPLPHESPPPKSTRCYIKNLPHFGVWGEGRSAVSHALCKPLC